MITVKYIYICVCSCGGTVSDVPGAALLAAGLRLRREQKNRGGGFPFPLHDAEHMPCCCPHCIALWCH